MQMLVCWSLIKFKVDEEDDVDEVYELVDEVVEG